jgi:2-dehydro-3-deoxyphosphogluconate aldolase/(4S)-4-hydroxy-2-oxoglutarate aldolase
VSPSIETARGSRVAAAIRSARLVVVLRGVAPRASLLDLVDGLADAGARVFEVTLDAEGAIDDLAAVRERLAARDPSRLVGAGTVRSPDQVSAAFDAGAEFGVSPVLDLAILAAALDAGLPFVPGAYTPTEADAAWRAGATFVKLFPGSSLGPDHVRELRGPLPEIETIVTGGVDATNAVEFLDAGAVAVGIGSAIVRASAAERRALIEAIASVGGGGR